MQDYFGFLLIDKPKGISSHDAVFEIRRRLNCKVGHAGTLDPFATGLLIMALGRATRLIEFLQKRDKEYEVEMVLGESRDSYDVTGNVLEQREIGDVSQEDFEKVLLEFRGEIYQHPPIYSAVKIDGERAYKKARRGEEFKTKKRLVTIHGIRLLEFAPPLVKLYVNCSTGTYVRSLINDVGEKFGSLAYAKNLRRISIDKFKVENSLSLEGFSKVTDEEIRKHLIAPIDALEFAPQLELTEEQLGEISFGRSFGFESKGKIKSDIVLGTKNGRIVAILNLVSDTNYVVAKPDKVFI